MANPVNINVSGINRPGVFVTQSQTGGLPQPLASHAIGYIFGSTPTDPYDDVPSNEYSSLQPYKPTQIGSLDDFTRRIGGVPTASSHPNSMISYDSVGAFFDNVGANGILYYTRVTPTPETKVVVTKGSGWNYFSLKIGGRYFGDKSLGVNDSEGVEIRVISTTALDANDNAFDIVGYLRNSDPDFNTYFRIEQDDEEALAATFKIYSKDVTSLPQISSFKAYQISDTSYASPVDAGTISFYVPVKELALRCASRDTTTNEPIQFISGGALGNFIETTSVTTNTNGTASFDSSDDSVNLASFSALSVGTDPISAGDVVVFESIDGTGTGAISGVDTVSYNRAYKVHSVDSANNKIFLQDPSSSSVAILGFTASNTSIVLRVRRLVYNTTSDQLQGVAITDSDVQGVVAQAIEDFLIDQSIYSGTSDIPDDKYVALSTDDRAGKLAHVSIPDIGSQYYQWNASTPAFEVLATVPSGDSSTRVGYLPDTVQVFYINVAGENRAVIANGATPGELTDSVRDSIKEILTEKQISEYYDVESVTVDYSGLGANTYAPNNGIAISTDPAVAGYPALRPSNDGRQLTGTVAVTSGNTTITGTGTKFTEELYATAPIVINGYRFTVNSITNDTSLVVTESPTFSVTSTTASLDSSAANGFFRHDYVLRLKITSKNGTTSPISAGNNRYGIRDTNVARVGSLDEAADFANYKLSAKARAQDFVYAIEQGMGSGSYDPGFVFAPEAFGGLTSEVGGLTKLTARRERIKVTQALLKAAEGKLGETEGISGTQHIALIDSGGDENTLSETQDELSYIKSTAGAPFGHMAFYAPYQKNTADRFVPPSGYIAGIACSRYTNEGFQQPPAGARYPLRGSVGVKFDITAQQQEVTYPLGINPIRSLPNRGIVAWGARTTSSNALYKFVNTRAILNVYVDALSKSFDDVLFEQIDSANTLYSRVKSIASQVASQLYRQGALFGARPEDAYLIVCSDANNSTVNLENGSLVLSSYVATSPTLERLLVEVIRTPAGQVGQIQDSFARNSERFDYLLNNATV